MALSTAPRPIASTLGSTQEVAAARVQETIAEAEAIERAAMGQLRGDDAEAHLDAFRALERALAMRARACQLADAAALRGTDDVRARCSAAAEQIVVVYNEVAVRSFKQGDFEGSSHLLSNAFRLCDVTDGGDGPLIRDAAARGRLKSTTLNNFGCMERRRGRLTVALQYMRHALEVASSQSPATLLNVSAVLTQMGNTDEAIGTARRAIGLLEGAAGPHRGDASAVFGAHEPSLRAVAHHNLAMALERRDPAEALREYERALELARAAGAAQSAAHIERGLQRVRLVAAAASSAHAQQQQKRGGGAHGHGGDGGFDDDMDDGSGGGRSTWRHAGSAPLDAEAREQQQRLGANIFYDPRKKPELLPTVKRQFASTAPAGSGGSSGNRPQPDKEQPSSGYAAASATVSLPALPRLPPTRSDTGRATNAQPDDVPAAGPTPRSVKPPMPPPTTNEGGGRANQQPPAASSTPSGDAAAGGNSNVRTGPSSSPASGHLPAPNNTYSASPPPSAGATTGRGGAARPAPPAQSPSAASGAAARHGGSTPVASALSGGASNAAASGPALSPTSNGPRIAGGGGAAARLTAREEEELRKDDAVHFMFQQLNALLKREEEFEQRYVAARTIQRAVRGMVARHERERRAKARRRAAKTALVRETNAARTVVAFFRGLQRRRRTAEEAKRLEQRRAAETERKLVTIQCAARRWHARRTLRRMHRAKLNLEHAVRIIQRATRCFVARVKYARMKAVRAGATAAMLLAERRQRAAVVIQAAYRRHHTGIQLLLAQGNVKADRERGWLLGRGLAAKRIQKLWRGARVRMQYGAALRDAQTRRRNREHKARRLNATIAIQSYFRGMRARAALRPAYRQLLLVRRERRRLSAHRAAVIIQCCFRSMVARAALRHRRAARRRQQQEERAGALHVSVRGYQHIRAAALDP